MKSSVNNSLVAVAVATVLGTGAAQALTPAQVAATPAANIFYAGGSSAAVNGVIYILNGLFAAGSADYYTDSTTGTKSVAYIVLTGNIAAGKTLGTLTAGNPVILQYKISGGSYPNGGLPQIVGSGTTSLAYPTQAALDTLPVGTTAGVVATGKVWPLPSWQYPANAGKTAIPDWGITDEEIGLFEFPDNGGATLTAAQVAGVTPTPLYDALFGLAVTNALYVGGGTPATQKTSFTRTEVAEILAGNYTDWSQLYADDGKTALAAGPIALLDRGTGSGTKAAGNTEFLNYPGAKATGGAVDPGSISAGYKPSATALYSATATVYQDIKEASSDAIVTDLSTAQTAGKRVISVLGMEFPPNLNQTHAGTNDYSFAKIDGIGVDTGYDGTVASPVTGFFHDNINTPNTGLDAQSHPYGTSYTNAVNGSYDFFYQASFNVRAPTSYSSSNGNALATLVGGTLSNNAISGISLGVKFPASVPGVLYDPVTAGGLVAGTTTASRSQNSTSPLLKVGDPTLGATVYGLDPL